MVKKTTGTRQTIDKDHKFISVSMIERCVKTIIVHLCFLEVKVDILPSHLG